MTRWAPSCSPPWGSASFPRAACYLREYGAEIIMIKGATPIPFKLLTITAGFIAMPLLIFIGASIVNRSISFMIVGVLFRLFGAPIKAFIDKYLGLAGGVRDCRGRRVRGGGDAIWRIAKPARCEAAAAAAAIR